MASFLFLNLSYKIVYYICLTHICTLATASLPKYFTSGHIQHGKIQPELMGLVEVSEGTINDQCRRPAESLWDWIWPVQTTLHPLQPPTPPPKSCLSLQPLTSWKNNPGITSRPHQGPFQPFAFIAVRMKVVVVGGVWMLRTGSFLREWKVGGVKGVNATQREVRKGKLAIHEGFGTCTPICPHMGSKHAWVYVDKVIKTSESNYSLHGERCQVKIYIVTKKENISKYCFFFFFTIFESRFRNTDQLI